MTERITVPIPLRWGDLDAYDHVNNVEVMRLLEEARVRAFWAPERPRDDSPPTAIVDAGAGSPTNTLIASHRIEYLQPIEYTRDPVLVELWFGSLGGASAEVCYEVFADGRLVARASSVMVFVDAATSRPRRLTEAERKAWEPYRGPRIDFTR